MTGLIRHPSTVLRLQGFVNSAAKGFAANPAHAMTNPDSLARRSLQFALALLREFEAAFPPGAQPIAQSEPANPGLPVQVRERLSSEDEIRVTGTEVAP
jgi:hypothetical protein